MASGSAKGGRKSSSAARYAKNSKGNKNSKNNKSAKQSELQQEILLFLALGVSVLLFLSVLGLLGAFGKIIRGVLIGLFGMVGYLFPFAFFFAAAFLISNKWERVVKVKSVSTFLLLWDLSNAAQLIFAKDRPVSKLTDYYTDIVKSGGLLGGVTTNILCRFLGMAGTIVIIIVIAIICIVLLTDRSIFTSVKEGKELISEGHKRNSERRREMSEIRDMQRQTRDLEYRKKRDERIVEYEQKQNEKLTKKREIIEKKLKEAEEKAEKASRIKFDALDLKKQEELLRDIDEKEKRLDEYEINDSPYGDEDDIVTRTEEAYRAYEPESLFYGNSREYISTVRAQTQETAADVTRIMAESDGGLLTATKLETESKPGDIVEITGSYGADDNFLDYMNSNFKTSHKINVSDAKDDLQEAYERDIYVDEGDDLNDDYSDVADVFGARFRKEHRNGHSISVGAAGSGRADDMLPNQFNLDGEDYVTVYEDPEEQQSAFQDAEYTAEPLKAYNPALNEYNFGQTDEPETEDSYNDEPVSSFKSDSGIVKLNPVDLEEENKKPAPVSGVVKEGKAVKTKRSTRYKFPPITLLDEPKQDNSDANAKRELTETAIELKDTLKTFGLSVEIIGSSRGPAVTRYEIQMPPGVSVKKITNLADDLMLSLGAKDIRIEAPIPGKKAVGIEIPNKESTMVHFREVIDSPAFKNFNSKVAFGVGKDLSGDIVVSDISKMPHLLIAGATGSGKSVCINTIIMSILYKASPEEVKFIMIDPKMVELAVYNDIPHLLIPVVTDARKASAALAWAVNEMTLRYQKFSSIGVRNMKGYNEKIKTDPQYFGNDDYAFMPQIIIVVDELADLMMVAAKEVEESICRLAQLARAAGIYLILATQRPSVDVITGLIKANMPSRIAFSVTSGVDSRTILDMYGAEKLLGYGDMFFFPRGYNKPSRVQGAYVDDAEVERVVDYIKEASGGSNYDENAANIINAGGAVNPAASSGGLVDPKDAFDDLFVLAAHAVIESEKASIGMLQRKFKIGFNRAARIMDQLCDEGVVGSEEGTKPRKILMSMDEFNKMIEEKNHS